MIWLSPSLLMMPSKLLPISFSNASIVLDVVRVMSLFSILAIFSVVETMPTLIFISSGLMPEIETLSTAFSVAHCLSLAKQPWGSLPFFSLMALERTFSISRKGTSIFIVVFSAYELSDFGG